MADLKKRMDKNQKVGGTVESYGAITGETPEVDQEGKLEDAATVLGDAPQVAREL